MLIDHVFICTAPGAPVGQALVDFGLSEGSPNRHPGQGTANRRFFFHNAMIELLWIEDAAAARNDGTRRTRLCERASADAGISPFGICFRPRHSSESHAPFPVWHYRPAYLSGDRSIEIADGPALHEPMWFFLSFGQRPDAAGPDRRQPLVHRNGLRELTAVRVSPLSIDDASVPARMAIECGCVSLGDEVNPLLELDFDGASAGRFHDFRPALPLVIRW